MATEEEKETLKKRIQEEHPNLRPQFFDENTRRGGPGTPRNPVTSAINRMSHGGAVTNPTVKKLVTPTPEEKALGILPKHKAALLKKLAKEHNPIFTTLDKTEFGYGLRLLVAEHYNSYLIKQTLLDAPDLDPKRREQLEKALERDRKDIFKMNRELGEFLFGKAAGPTVNVQQNVVVDSKKFDFAELTKRVTNRIKMEDEASEDVIDVE